ncbi:MAG TPA: DNA translocase FtsK [Chloroflexi bacterium]|nr:DNA translocase FtsK [Chloroflexota bacterium]
MNQLTNAPNRNTALAHHLTRRTLATMEHRKALKPNLDGVVCVAWPHPKRLVMVFHPQAVDEKRAIKPNFYVDLRDDLRETLGRRVVVSNGNALYVQVGYEPSDSTLSGLPDRIDLDLSDGPSGDLMVPLGVTRRGPRWLSLCEMDSILIGGTRRMGKTMLLHAWILALAAGESPAKVRLYLADGKGGNEFRYYANLPHVEETAGSGEELMALLGNLRQELARRTDLLNRHEARNIQGLPADVRPPYLVLIVDELAINLDTEGVEEALHALVARGGAYGVLPVLATQRPDSSMVAGFLKGNLSTRISLPVPTNSDSRVILGRSGAEKLPKKKGRILFEWEGRMVQAQSYFVSDDVIKNVCQRLGRGEAPLDPPLSLKPWEKRLVRIAVAEGFAPYFPLKELAEASNVSYRQLLRLGRRWEMQGLLTPPSYEEGTGRKLARRMTGQLRDLEEGR